MPRSRVTFMPISKIWLTGTPGFMAAMAAHLAVADARRSSARCFSVGVPSTAVREMSER